MSKDFFFFFSFSFLFFAVFNSICCLGEYTPLVTTLATHSLETITAEYHCEEIFVKNNQNKNS